MKIEGAVINKFLKDVKKEIKGDLFSTYESNSENDYTEFKDICFNIYQNGFEQGLEIVGSVMRTILNEELDDKKKIRKMANMINYGASISKNKIKIKSR